MASSLSDFYTGASSNYLRISFSFSCSLKSLKLEQLLKFPELNIVLSINFAYFNFSFYAALFFF